ncbi:MAG TPA: CARDB domain-containing protein [bacterium]|nr:CARDB domain-containing protein [bacterium]
MKKLFVITALAVSLVGAFSCGDSTDETDETGDDNGAGDCTTSPDLSIDQFSVFHYGEIGNAFNVDSVTICNGGGAAAEANHRFGAYLSTSADGNGEFYLVYESGALAGIAAGDCQTFSATGSVPAIPAGYYYIYLFADIDNNIAECNEGNNGARSDDAPYFG